MIISGKVVNSNNQAVPYASIELRTQSGQYLGYGVTADQFGEFRIDADIIGSNTFLVVSHVGYESKMFGYATYTSQSVFKLGSQSATTLPEVVVTASPTNNPTKGTGEKIFYGLLIANGIYYAYKQKWF